MLNNFIYAQTKELFLEALGAGNILDEAIVFIEDTKEIWNHGSYFGGDCGFDETAFNHIQAAVAQLQTTTGSSSVPIYISGGVPVECGGTLDVDINGLADRATVSVYASVNEMTDSETKFIVFSGATNASTQLGAKSTNGLSFNPGTNQLAIGDGTAQGVLKIGGCTLTGYYNSSSTNTNNYMYINAQGGVRCSAGFYETSDENLKEFKGQIPVDFERLKQIPKKYFVWKNDSEQKLQIGTSAQEVQKIYPELVSKSEDGTLSVNYNKLSIVALQAVDILNDKCNELEARIAKLEALLIKE